MSGDWFQAAGFAVLGWGLIAVAGALTIKGRGQQWYTWTCGVLGALSTLAAGTYIADLNLVRGVIGFIESYPLITFILFIVTLAGLFRLGAMFIPDDFHPLSFGVAAVMLLMLVPSAVQFIPGDVGAGVQSVEGTYSSMVRGEAGTWFRPRGDQPGAK